MSELEIVRFSAPTVRGNLDIDTDLARAAAREGRRVLRLWWGGPPTAVLGCGDNPERELDLDACERLGIGITRRVTGGGTVLLTESVANYSYTAPDPGALDIHETFAAGARLVVEMLSAFGIRAHARETSDVAVGWRKISGNAQARKWHAILLHGTVLVDIDLHLMESILRRPSREPDYREGRPHSDFIITMNHLGLSPTREEIEDAFEHAARRVEMGPRNGGWGASRLAPTPAIIAPSL